MKIYFSERFERRTRTRAFTLAEVMVSVVLLLFMAMALYAGVAYGFALMQLNREDLRATQIMVKRMENLRLYRYDQVTSPTYVPRSFTTYYDPTADGGGGVGAVYSGTITMTNPAASSGLPGYRTNMQLVTVTLYWTNTIGKSGPIVRRREMQTYVARNGVQNYVY